jgi:dihydroorotase
VRLLLKNGRVVDPSAGIDGAYDVLVEEGRIARVAARIEPSDANVLDLAGLCVCPGFIDMHVHLREPGQEWKETIATGTRAAAAGGFTGVACMPNTQPPIDSRSVVEFVLAQARQHGAVPVYPIGCVSKGQAGVELAEMGDMAVAGARGFSDDGKPVASAGLMRRALEYSKIFDLPVIDHCEEPTLVAGGVAHEGEVATRLGLPGWPGVAEDVMVSRDILLAEYTGGAIHIAHMSTGRSAELVRQAKQAKIRVTCEVTPHHFALTDEAVAGYDTHAKMNPPLRTESDRRALLEAIADGTVDVIASDHAPHNADEKCVEFSQAPFGIVGLETAVSICLDRLVHGQVIGLSRLVELLACGPAAILRIKKGSIRAGDDADITVLDLDRRVVVQPSSFASKSVNTPFGGWTLRGGPVLTIVGGRIVHDAR